MKKKKIIALAIAAIAVFSLLAVPASAARTSWAFRLMKGADSSYTLARVKLDLLSAGCSVQAGVSADNPVNLRVRYDSGDVNNTQHATDLYVRPFKSDFQMYYFSGMAKMSKKYRLYANFNRGTAGSITVYGDWCP